MISDRESAQDLAPISIRGMVSSDVPAVIAILRESPEASLWSENSVQECAIHGRAWVGETDGLVVGFLIGWVVADEFEILNMAVGRSYRKRGIGSELVRHSLRQARKSGANRVHLEVRASNQPAIVVYKRHGFVTTGRRARYYQDPIEDALLFTMELESTGN